MRRWPLKWKHAGIALGLIILLAMIIDFNQRTDELNRLTSQLEGVRAEGTAVMQTQVALVTHIAYATSDDAVEDWAYVGNHWVRNDEHLISIIPNTNITPTPSLLPISQTQQLPNWRVWQELFFSDN